MVTGYFSFINIAYIKKPYIWQSLTVFSAFLSPVLPDIAFLNVIHVFFFDCEKLRFSSVFFTNHVFPTFFRPFLQYHTSFDPYRRYLLQYSMFKKNRSRLRRSQI